MELTFIQLAILFIVNTYFVIMLRNCLKQPRIDWKMFYTSLSSIIGIVGFGLMVGNNITFNYLGIIFLFVSVGLGSIPKTFKYNPIPLFHFN